MAVNYCTQGVVDKNGNVYNMGVCKDYIGNGVAKFIKDGDPFLPLRLKQIVHCAQFKDVDEIFVSQQREFKKLFGSDFSLTEIGRKEATLKGPAMLEVMAEWPARYGPSIFSASMFAGLSRSWYFSGHPNVDLCGELFPTKLIKCSDGASLARYCTLSSEYARAPIWGKAINFLHPFMTFFGEHPEAFPWNMDFNGLHSHTGLLAIMHPVLQSLLYKTAVAVYPDVAKQLAIVYPDHVQFSPKPNECKFQCHIESEKKLAPAVDPSATIVPATTSPYTKTTATDTALNAAITALQNDPSRALRQKWHRDRYGKFSRRVRTA